MIKKLYIAFWIDVIIVLTLILKIVSIETMRIIIGFAVYFTVWFYLKRKIEKKMKI